MEVALTQGLANNISFILNGEDADVTTNELDTVTFYSINATQEGLSGMELAGHMIYRAMSKLQDEGWIIPYGSNKKSFPLKAIQEASSPTRSAASPSRLSISSTDSGSLESDFSSTSPASSPSTSPSSSFDPAAARRAFQQRRVSTFEAQTVITFATLSPIPSFANWLRSELVKNPSDDFFHADDVELLNSYAKANPALFAASSTPTTTSSILSQLISTDFSKSKELLTLLEKPLIRLCLHYLLDIKQVLMGFVFFFFIFSLFLSKQNKTKPNKLYIYFFFVVCNHLILSSLFFFFFSPLLLFFS